MNKPPAPISPTTHDGYRYGCFGCDFKSATIAEMEDHYFDNHPENLNVPAYVQKLRKKIAQLAAPSPVAEPLFKCSYCGTTVAEKLKSATCPSCDFPIVTEPVAEPKPEEARLREALLAAHEWAAEFPLQGYASRADLRAAENVYELTEAALRSSGKGE